MVYRMKKKQQLRIFLCNFYPLTSSAAGESSITSYITCGIPSNLPSNENPNDPYSSLFSLINNLF